LEAGRGAGAGAGAVQDAWRVKTSDHALMIRNDGNKEMSLYEESMLVVTLMPNEHR